MNLTRANNYDPKTGTFRRSVVKPVPKAQVMAMYADYQTGMSLSAVGRKHRNIIGNTVRDIFEKRGLVVREVPNRWERHKANGCFARMKPKTEKKITAMIAAMTRLTVPAALRLDWRKWPMSRRGEFIRRSRKSLAKNHGRVFAPTTPHSSNVQPFDYTTPAARVIAEKDNVGKNSQECPTKLKPASQGVIYKGTLYYWSAGIGYQCCLGIYDPEVGRPQLHRVIYEEHFGPIHAGMTVIQKDGNKNNFSPDNLALRSMADCARLNAWHRRPEKFPGLMKRAAVKAWITRDRNSTLKGRAQFQILLRGTITAKLLRRKYET
jgi:hypothetical protein